ncbi:MAG: 4-hydroxythreonine-4-phosphate dehydrogenase PdxA [Pseudomonadota bacterium]
MNRQYGKERFDIVNFRPIIGITMGDPAGIGPEIILSGLSHQSLYKICRPFVLGDIKWLEIVRKIVINPLPVRPISTPESGTYDGSCINVLNLSSLNPDTTTWGKTTPETADATVRYIKAAVTMTLNWDAEAMVTCPINKKALQLAGIRHPGHTEWIAEMTNTPDFVMMMAGKRLKVALVTIHTPLKSVPDLISTETIAKTIRITAEGLMNRFGIRDPRIAVAGLNPHAGEKGRFGKEEEEIIRPAVFREARTGIRAEGPFPPDTVFYRAIKGAYDAVVCMYHDQGLIPFKLTHFTDGVNVTLGIPIIRTSVDHGTAYDIAGTGKGDPKSLMAAIRMAADHVKCLKCTKPI